MIRNDTSDLGYSGVSSRAAQAAERRTARQRKVAEDEIDRLLGITLELIESSAPAMPSVSEIVAAAGISNQTLYRSFPSKDDLMLAVLEQGVFRVAEAVAERMARTTDPQQQVVEWVRGVLRQVSHGDAAKTSRSVLGHLGRAGVSDGKGGQAELLAPIADLLLGPLAELGEGRTESVDCISDLVFGAMRRYLWSGVGPERVEVDRVSGFVLGGLGLTASEGGAHA